MNSSSAAALVTDQDWATHGAVIFYPPPATSAPDFFGTISWRPSHAVLAIGAHSAYIARIHPIMNHDKEGMVNICGIIMHHPRRLF
ncbi:hypothetical protein BC827DRAFT_1173870 [Russula dissimulans]|nr:hypothetical protein BC827DRAFT_1173870 [Russula dissimulans]